MTSNELAEYRREVRGALIHAGKQAGQDIIHRRGFGRGPTCTIASRGQVCTRSGQGQGQGQGSAQGLN